MLQPRAIISCEDRGRVGHWGCVAAGSGPNLVGHANWILGQDLTYCYKAIYSQSSRGQLLGSETPSILAGSLTHLSLDPQDISC